MAKWAHLLRDLLEVLHTLDLLHRDRTVRRHVEHLGARPLHDVRVLAEDHRREREGHEIAALAREDQVTDIAAQLVHWHVGVVRRVDHERDDVVVLLPVLLERFADDARPCASALRWPCCTSCREWGSGRHERVSHVREVVVEFGRVLLG